MSDLTAVSLFAGIGGIDRALELAGVKVTAAVEIDPDCRGVLRRHFPDTAIFNDVTEVTGDQLRATGFVPGRGILTGGFPCQDLSVAGRRKGLGGARSGLFWHIMRLADDLHPRWILLENVPGLLSAVCPCPGGGACVANRRAVRCGEWRVEPAEDSPDLGPACPVCGHDWEWHDAGGFCNPCQDTCEGLPEVRQRKVWFPDIPHGVKGGACPAGCMPAHGGAMGTVLGALGHRGYGIAYRVLDAQFFGVPQRRERVFIAGCLGDRAAPVQVLLEPESSGGDPPPGGQAWTDIAATLGSRFGGARTTDPDGGGAYITAGTLRSHPRPGSADPGGVVTGTLLPGSVGDYDDNTARAGDAGDPMFTLQAGKQHGVAFNVTPQGHRTPDGWGGFSDAGLSVTETDQAATVDGQAGSTRIVTGAITAGWGTNHGAPGHGGKDDAALAVIAATLQGGGRRGHRIDAEGAAGGHLIPVAIPVQDGRGRDHKEQHGLGVGGEGDPAYTPDAGSGIIVVPVASRGRAGGAQMEAGEPGDPAFALRGPGGGSSYPMVAHALTSEGADASEDGTGRGTPLVVSPVAAALTAGVASRGVSRPGRRQEDDVNLVPVMPVTSVSNDASPVVGHNRVGALKVGTGLGTPSAPAVATAMAVRRLTPRECERLQGFPDDWTRWLADGTEQSDSARYRQCGNAVAVPVVAWITRRIVAVWRASQGSRGVAA